MTSERAALRAVKKAESIISRADQDVLAKDNLKLADVKTYLHKRLHAISLLSESHTVAHYSRERLTRALNNWDDDRTLSLLILIDLLHPTEIQTSQEQNLSESEAVTRCLSLIVNNPLIPSQNQSDYTKIVLASGAALKKAQSSDHRTQRTLSIFAFAIFYNAERFCPESFFDCPSPEAIEKDEQQLANWLIALRTGSPLTNY